MRARPSRGRLPRSSIKFTTAIYVRTRRSKNLVPLITGVNWNPIDHLNKYYATAGSISQRISNAAVHRPHTNTILPDSRGKWYQVADIIRPPPVSNHKPHSIIIASTGMIAPLFFHSALSIRTKLVAAGDSTARAANNSRQVSIARNVINRLMATIMGLRICMELQSIIQKFD